MEEKKENKIENEDEKEELKEDKTTDSIKEGSNAQESINQKQKPKISESQKKLIVIIILVVLTFVLVGLFLFEKLYNVNIKRQLQGEMKQEEELLRDAENNAINEYGLSLEKANLEYYIKTNSYLSINDLQNKVEPKYNIYCEEKEAYTDGSVYLNQCKIDNVEVYTSYGIKKENIVTETKVEMEGNILLVYESISEYGSSTLSLNEPIGEDNVKVHRININTSENGSISLINNMYISYWDDKHVMQLVDVMAEKKVAENENYDGIYLFQIDGTWISTANAAIYKNGKFYLYDLNKKEYISNEGYDQMDPYIYGCGISGQGPYLKTIEGNKLAVVKDKKYGLIDLTDGKQIIPVKYNKFLMQGQLIVATDDNRGHLFSIDGKEFLSNTNVENIYAGINNAYVLVKQNGHIKLLLVNGDELYDFGEYTVDHLHVTGSKADEIKAEIAEGSTSSKCVKFTYDLVNKKGNAESNMCSGISKPILYFYPENDINVDVTFDDPSVLETTYPKYKNGWNVLAKKDGSLYDKDGKYYYALYWDEQKIHSVDFTEGFYVTKNNAIEFLEEKLTYIGLNDKEKNEFIMYWLPILEKNKKSLVYFELTEERNSYSKININPQPDSMLRLVIHIKKVNKKTNIKEEKLVPFERTGFAAVEWGGTTY